MKAISPKLRERLEAEEKARILGELQAAEARTRSFLSPPDLFTRRYRRWLELGGEILIGSILAMIAVIFNFFLFVRILHFGD